jgi:metallophosphoesterase superfamily enzyme
MERGNGMKVSRYEVEPGLWLDGRGAVFLERTRRLVIADLHYGYELAQRSAGNLFPAWGRKRLEEEVERLVMDWSPEELVLLGDLVHTRTGWPAFGDWMNRLPLPVRLIRGNHDRAVPVGIQMEDQWETEGWVLHHGDRSPLIPPGCREMVGHWHPSFILRDGGGLRRRVPGVVIGAERVVLPAFSPWSQGTGVEGMLREGERLWVVTPGKIVEIPRRWLEREAKLGRLQK